MPATSDVDRATGLHGDHIALDALTIPGNAHGPHATVPPAATRRRHRPRVAPRRHAAGRIPRRAARAPGAVVAVACCRGQGTPKQQADAASRHLDRVFPGIVAARGSAREARFHWPSHPWSLGSYACLHPGDWSSLRGVMGESVGGLHFAGEHCALETQGFMEGGCESGELAARAVLAQRGVAVHHR